MAESRTVKTTADCILALGGIRAVAELTGQAADHRWKNVEGWNRAEHFPPRYFLVMWLELFARGYEAPPSLWRQAVAPNRKAVVQALARKLVRAAA
jgi:hypothetical protein